jgi:hypothetical protein
MTQPPAAWYPDPENVAQQRYWDGTQWTEHRAPAAGADFANALGNAADATARWLTKVTTAAPAGAPTFEQIAAACRDEAPRQPLSATVQALIGPQHVDPVRRVFADAAIPITGAGATLERPCRLVPNPWNPADPAAVAVLVGIHLVGQLPPDAAASYGPKLVALSQQQLLATGTASFTASYDGTVVSARATLSLPEVTAFP